MRILYNHGFTINDLYESTPPRVIDRRTSWFEHTYGWKDGRVDALARPFKYFLGLVLHHIIDKRERFVLPNVPHAYFDFNITNEEKFEYHRQCGRFQEVDFIESDFTGYDIHMVFKARGGYKKTPLRVGGELKRKFLDYVNSGVKFYSIRDCHMSDFLLSVEKKFPHHTKDEIKKLIVHGIRRLHSVVKYGCAISMFHKKSIDCVFHLGFIYGDLGKQIRSYGMRWKKKLRRLDTWRKTPFDGFYYIGLNPRQFEKLCEENQGKYVRLNFSDVFVTRIQDELYYEDKHKYIFKIPVDRFRGWVFHRDKLMVRFPIFLGESIDRHFYPSNKTWQQILKDYEKGKHK